MWHAPGKPDDSGRFPSFTPVEVLYEFDGPRIFTIRDSDGGSNLVYWSDEDGQTTRYVVSPTSDRILDNLRGGVLSVLEALDQPRCWLCDVDREGNLLHCHLVDFESIPGDAKPARGTLLWPSLESLEPQLVEWEGRVRELDKDRLSFELREIGERPGSQKFVFDEELLADVFQALRDDERVRVTGNTSPARNLAHARALSSPRQGAPRARPTN